MQSIFLNIFWSVIALVPFLVVWFISKRIFGTLASKERLKDKRHVINFLSSIATVIICIVAAITAFGTVGVDVSAMLAGLGLTGFALGFALKDVLSSTIAGFMILFYRPFKLKDQIIVLGVEGQVSDINMRYTTLKKDGQLHLIPNSKIISEKVTVLGRKK